MHRAQTPVVLWDFCCQYMIELRNRLARPLQQLNGRTPYELIIGNTPDISEFLEFCWYQPIWYYESNTFPQENRLLGHWIGIAHRVGQAMCYWVLPSSGVPIPRTTIQDISKEEQQSEMFRQKLQAFDERISMKLNRDLKLYRVDEDSEDANCEYQPIEPEVTPVDVDEIEPDSYDELLLTEPTLIRDGQPMRAKVVGRKQDHNDNLIGSYNPNPILNSRIYLAEFANGHIQEFSANTIIEAIYDYIDDEEYQEQIFRDIVGHKCNNEALTKTQAEAHRKLHQSLNNLNRPICTTKGWEICISWQDGSTSWHPLRDIKNSFPLQLAKYAV
jgi:hypothetical protein